MPVNLVMKESKYTEQHYISKWLWFAFLFVFVVWAPESEALECDKAIALDSFFYSNAVNFLVITSY